MKRLFPSIFMLAMLVLLLGSCASYKKVPYFKNIEEVDLSASRGLFDATIVPKDLLSIYVSTTDPEAAKPFNLISGNGNIANVDNNSNSLTSYLVDNEGNINFPVIGKIHVLGLTKNQCQDLIREKLLPYMSKTENPVVTVRMSGFRVTIIGEVGGSRVIPVTSEKMSIIEAIAQAGDLSIYGMRDNILLIREDATGQKSYHRLNINDANILNSPYYYVQQNDIIYVQPNKIKSQNSTIGSATSFWFSIIGTLASLAAMVVAIVK